MSGDHALLSPSSSERWISCPASVGLVASLPVKDDDEGGYAHEGTAAHGLAEIKLRHALGELTDAGVRDRRVGWAREYPEYASDPGTVSDMERHTDDYVALVLARRQRYPQCQVLVEQRMPTGVPESFGTSDAVLVSPQHIEIIDFKYGRGVAVQAAGNPQLRLYACGALDTFGDVLGVTEYVFVTVHQPRLLHVLTEELTADELRGWRDEVAIPAARLALRETDAEPHYGPSEDACRWCPASGQCRAQLEAVFGNSVDSPPDALSDEELAQALAQAPMIQDWLKAVHDAALDRALLGQRLPGYKVVRGSKNRRVVDPEAAARVLADEGYDPTDYQRTQLRGIGDLERLLGKAEFHELLEVPGLVVKPPGEPALVPESDARPALDPDQEAVNVFSD